MTNFMNQDKEKQSGYIEKLYLRNFRKFEKVEIEFKDGFNFLIGPNNSGKSTILQALDILFGEKNLSPEKVEEIMFNEKIRKEQNKYFTIATEIKFPKCGSGDKQINIIKNLKAAKGSSRSTLPNYELTEKFNIYSILDERKNINNDNSNYSDNIGKDNENVKASKVYFICDVIKDDEYISVNYFLFLESDNENNFNGFKILISPYQIKKILNFLLIPAGRSENNQLFKVESYTWLGEYLKNIQNNKQGEINNYFNKHEEEKNNFPIQPNKEVKEILNKIIPNQKIYDIEISSFNSQHPDQMYKYSHFFVKDPSCEEIYYKGNGIQSATAISLFGDFLKMQCAKQTKNKSVDEFWAGILALEEPESHFHPPVRMRLSKVLKQKFVDLGVQVIISTHDENFPKWPKINNANLIFPNSIKDNVVVIRNFKGNNNDIERMMRFMSSTFYGNNVVIAEGKEVDCLNPIFDNLFGEDLSDLGIGMVQAVSSKPRSDRIHDEEGGGVDNIIDMIKLYKELDIKVACLIDADAVFKNGTVEKIYKELTDQNIVINTEEIISEEKIKEIRKTCRECDNCVRGSGQSIMNYIKEREKYDDYIKLIEQMNKAGIFFFNTGDFEANFKDNFLTDDLLNKDKTIINKEKFVYAVKYKAETEDKEKFKEILSDGAEDNLKDNFDLIKNFFEEKNIESTILDEQVEQCIDFNNEAPV